MNNINITPIVQAAIVLIASIVTTFVVPWIRSKVKNEDMAINSWNTMNRMVVTGITEKRQGDDLRLDRPTRALTFDEKIFQKKTLP